MKRSPTSASTFSRSSPRTKVATSARGRELRFSAADSPYHGTGRKEFPELPEGAKLHEACFGALAKLDREGFFGQGKERAKVLVNVVYGDMSNERWVEHAKRLNAPDAIAAVLPFFHLNVPSGNVTRWGGAAYQVNGLSLSADRALLAYSGSGGEVGVMRIADQKAIYEKRRAGEHWACALSPDGARLHLGEADGIGLIETWTGKYKTWIKHAKPGALALSPNGTRLAVSSWDAPLTVFDAASGKGLWTHATTSAALAFSPDGKSLAVAVGDFETKTSRVRCLDVATGSELWSAQLGKGMTSSIAWTPHGDALLGAASEWPYTPDGGPGQASLAFFGAKDGDRLRELPWQNSVDAVAISPSGMRIGICAGNAIVMLDAAGIEIARGTGGQESLGACAFIDDDRVIAVGRDVNNGPALLDLRNR